MLKLIFSYSSIINVENIYFFSFYIGTSASLQSIIIIKYLIRNNKIYRIFLTVNAMCDTFNVTPWLFVAERNLLYYSK